MTFRVYKRVSTQKQNNERQQVMIDDFLAKEQIQPREVKIYEDKASGKNTKRPAFQRMLKDLESGDTVLVSEMDRLGRNMVDITKTIQQISDKKATFRIIDFPLVETGDPSTTKLIRSMMLEVFSYIAEKEREKILERTRQGRELAKREGRLTGRPKALSETGSRANDWRAIISLYNEGKKVSEIAKLTEVSIPSVYSVIKDWKAQQ